MESIQINMPWTAQIIELDSEPRPANHAFIFPSGPPPSYRSSTYADDSSFFSGSSSALNLDKRRISWMKLIESKESLSLHGVNNRHNDSQNPANYDYEPNFNKHSKSFTMEPSGALYANMAPISSKSVEKEFNETIFSIHTSKESKLSRKCSSTTRFSGLLTSIKAQKYRFDFVKPYCEIICVGLFLASLTAPLLVTIVSLINNRNITQYSWMAPFSQRMGPATPNLITMTVNDNQIRFDLEGHSPFQTNYMAIYDFYSKKIAIIDSTIKNNGKTMVCFLMDFNSTTFPDADSVKLASKNSLEKTEQLQGWEETWNYIAMPSIGTDANNFFNPSIDECGNARWIKLRHTNADQRGQHCSECFDFCLPEFGVEADSIRDEKYLNIVRRNCFRLFIPEWRSYIPLNQREVFDNFGQRLSRLEADGVNEPVKTTAVISTINDYSVASKLFESKWIILNTGTDTTEKPFNVQSAPLFRSNTDADMSSIDADETKIVPFTQNAAFDKS